MTYTVSGANFNKDVAAQGTSINYKENKAVKSEGVAGSFAGVVISGSVTAATENTYEGLLKEADDVKSQIMASASSAKISLKALMMKLSGADALILQMLHQMIWLILLRKLRLNLRCTLMIMLIMAQQFLRIRLRV